MQYQLDNGIWSSVFAVPTAVVDAHLRLSGGVQLKALLWVLRQGTDTFEDSALGEALGISPADARDALSYWQETGILQFHAEGTAAAPETAASAPQTPESQRNQSAATPAVPKHYPLPRAERPDPAFVAKRMQESEEIRCLMEEAEQILGRLLSPGDLGVLLMLHDHYGLPVDVILMLLQYAASNGKGNMRYIEKVAQNWADEGITTHMQAEEKLQALTNVRRAWDTVQRTLGLPARAPSTREENYVSAWVLDWKFSPEMIKLAYDRCIDATGKFAAGYIHKILERWHREKITTPQQVEADAQKKARSREEAAQPSYDIDAYERESWYDTMEDPTDGI